MRPLKAAVPLAKWLLRLSVAFYLIISFYDGFSGFSLNTLNFWFSAILIVFSVLLVVGGFSRTASMTVISGLVIFLLCIISIFLIYNSNLLFTSTEFSVLGLILPAAIGFYFFSRGNMG